MQQIPFAERPRERLLEKGAEALSHAELIAILLGSGTRGQSVLSLAGELLQRFSTLSKLMEASASELMEVKGVGRAKALQLEAAFTLAKRLMREEGRKLNQVTTAKEAFLQLKDLFHNRKEERLALLLLNAQSEVIGREVISIGTLTELLIHPREVFYPAIRSKAHRVLMAHNHPSGSLTPSKEDIAVTKTLVEAGNLLGIPVVDHLIIAGSSYQALSEII